MSYGEKFTPTELKKVDDQRVGIAWADGHECAYAMDILRFRCPCAQCVNEFTGERMIRYEDVAGTTVKGMSQVGTYAFSIRFSDGHETGIFTWKKLRTWCEDDEDEAA